MDNLFTLKTKVALFTLLICHVGLKAQTTLAMNKDTASAKKADVPMVVKSDTTLLVKAGATLVQRADTTLVINADSPLAETSMAQKAETPATDQKDNAPAIKTDAKDKKTENILAAVKVEPTSVKKEESPLVRKEDVTPQTSTDAPAEQKPEPAAVKANEPAAQKADTTVKTETPTYTKSDTTFVVIDTVGSHPQIKAENGYLEIGGPGLAISANYDARFKKERDGWGYRVGMGFFASGGNHVFSIPFQVNYLIGETKHFLELGAGTTFLNSNGTNKGDSKWEFDKVTGFIATATIGYRYQPTHKGLNFRIAFVPILYDEGLIPAGGVSVGYTFK